MSLQATRLDRRLTASDLDDLPHEWDTRYELVGGVLFMSRRPPFEHQQIIARLLMSVGPAILAVGGCAVPEPGIVWDEDGEDNVSPDVAILLAGSPARGAKLRTCPDIVAEVVSPGSENRRRDFEAKRDLYLRRGAREYWIVDPEFSEVHRLVRHEDTWQQTQVLRGTELLTTPLVPGWAGISVADLVA